VSEQVTATNHALTGAIIGLVIGEPLIALPAALVSHFICDAIPHFGSHLPQKMLLKAKAFRNYLIFEAVFCSLLVIGLAARQPQHWLLAAACAFVAAAPDLASAGRYFKIRQNKTWQANWYTKFAKDIQWFERPIGAVVEAAWFAAAIIILIPFLR
jgi:hypothetical protein